MQGTMRIVVVVVVSKLTAGAIKRVIWSTFRTTDEVQY